MSTNTLVQLYREMADLTQPECAKSCTIPFSCCDAEYCEEAIEIAKEHYGIELQRTNHPRLPLMGWDGTKSTGCIAPPHTRPLCTLHTCAISSLGFKLNDPEWTERYFALREKIDEIEFGSYATE